jgi:hypothetical protein
MNRAAQQPTRVAVVAPIKYGAYSEARKLIEAGPPFDPTVTPLDSHDVFLTDTEVVFVFEGVGVREAVEALLEDVAVWQALVPWQQYLAGRPRLAEGLYHWSAVDVPPAAAAA